jgi:hypothetical protein
MFRKGSATLRKAAFVGDQGKTVIDPDFDIDDSGLPHEIQRLDWLDEIPT